GGFDLAPGRRHRDHEYPAGIGNRADPGDRPAHGARGAQGARAATVPGRVGVSERRRGYGWHPYGGRGIGARLVDSWLADRDLRGRDRRRLRLLGGRWHLLRLLSGPESRRPESHRGVAVRMRPWRLLRSGL